jgi:hypothetical protein
MPNHLPEVREEMRACSPEVEVIRRGQADRYSVIDALPPSGCVGVELGVAGGGFSAAMVRTERFAKFYGVDAYTGGHSANEYKSKAQRSRASLQSALAAGSAYLAGEQMPERPADV